MKNKKMISTVLGLTILSTVSILGVSNIVSYADEPVVAKGKVNWYVNSAVNKRYTKGYFKGSPKMLKNPTRAGANHLGTDEYYDKDTGLSTLF